MRLVLTSDLHGHLPDLPSGDVLIVAGDLCPIDDHSPDRQLHWLLGPLTDWLRSAPVRHRIIVAGNHDFLFAHAAERLAEWSCPARYLEDAGCQVDGVAFWGSPWSNLLHGWPFTATEDDLAQRWQRIDPSTQVLIVHGPPFGYGDEVIGSRSGEIIHVGSRTLVEAIDRLPSLRLVVYGHIHEGAGVYRRGTVDLYNVALMDKRYQPLNPVRVYDLSVGAEHGR